jgi:hypothetical protein
VFKTPSAVDHCIPRMNKSIALGMQSHSCFFVLYISPSVIKVDHSGWEKFIKKKRVEIGPQLALRKHPNICRYGFGIRAEEVVQNTHIMS